MPDPVTDGSETPRIGSAWVLSDGKAGDENQCIAVAEALGAPYETRRVSPRPPFVWFMPRGPIDPRERPSRPQSPIHPPYPDLVIASGRRAAPYLRHVRRASAGKTMTVFLKDPHTGPETADFIWVPEHDPLRGPNVLATPTPPHRFSASRLRELRYFPPAQIARLAKPRVAVLVGGDSRHHHFSDYDVESFGHALEHLGETSRLMITLSRRTPSLLADRISRLATGGPHLLWDGTGENPLAAYLANAEAVVVTADSTNMVGEAAATGRPVLVYEPSGGHRKISVFLEKMSALGVTRPFAGRLETYRYEPIDSTPVIADEIRRRFQARRTGRPE
ncbi:mitochondrial fission ELM1 family protein [Breoghania sp.]|uniref:mitochondrial fission ELM1 family protein n=1 Tax=Breoghania sp. TaxID=2065378 RepID=UPI002AA68492|nr:mitochondrial fission ELM1 family protein [Breoghania sp.]